jgi:predicted unusual protein kinase regulating ubiquinone biosynthesis (AarF/ABC1/UbiB family)
MIAKREKTHKRRSEVLQCLVDAFGNTRRTRVPWRSLTIGHPDAANVERLCRAQVKLGPPFMAYGLYLSTRGDLVTSAERRCLAAIGREFPQLPSQEIQAIVRLQTDRASRLAARPAAANEALAALDDEPFDTRLLIQRHYGRLASGRRVIVRVVRPGRSLETDLELIPLLRDAVGPLLSDDGLFAQSVDDFRASYAAQTNGLALADALDFLRRDARGLDSIRIAEVYREISTARVLMLEHVPGRRFGVPAACAGLNAASVEPVRGDSADEWRGELRADESLARLACENSLRQVFDGGLVSTDQRPEDLIFRGRTRIAIDEETFAATPDQTRTNLLKYLIAVAVDDPRKALDCLLKEFEATRQRTPIDELDRLFRQIVPDVDVDERSEVGAGRLS